MKRNFFIICLVALIVCTSVFIVKLRENRHSLPNENKEYVNSNTETGNIPDGYNKFERYFSCDSIYEMSQEQAVQLLCEKIGTKDDGTFMFQPAVKPTGRNIGYNCETAGEYMGQQYFIVRIMWTNAEDSVWSTIGYICVSTDGKQICNVLENGSEEFLIGEAVWQK